MHNNYVRDVLAPQLVYVGSLNSNIAIELSDNVALNMLRWTSPIFNSFLLYSKLQLKDVIENITFNYSNINEDSVDVLEASNKDKIRLQITFNNANLTNNAIGLKESPFSQKEESTLTFDYILKHLKQFTDLPLPIKERIVNQEFLYDYFKLNTITEENVEEIKKVIIEGKEKALLRDLKTIDERVKDLFDRLSSARRDRNYTLAQLEGIRNQDVHLEKVKKVFKDPRIQKVILDSENKRLQIITSPIMLEYDTAKKNAHPKTKNLKEGEELCIGHHLINIFLETFKISFSPLNNNLINSHVEAYTCYGNFAEHLAKAQMDNNLGRLVSLGLQLISHATINDPAGNDTLKNSIVIDKQKKINATTHINTHLLDTLNDQGRYYIRRENSNES